MSGPRSDRATLLWAAARARTLDELVLLCGSDGAATEEGRDRLRDALAALKVDSDPGPAWRAVRERYGAHWAEVAGYHLAFSARHRSPAQTRSLEALAGELLSRESYFWPIFMFVSCKRAIEEKVPSQAEHFLAKLDAWFETESDSFIREIVDPFRRRAYGLYHQLTGNFSKAFESFSAAQKRSRDLALAMTPMLEQEWGTLLWLSGQNRRALDVHCSDDHRKDLEDYSAETRTRSHLSAAKCAIDLEELALAEKELRAAEQLIRETERISQLSQGYMLLYRGELALASGASQGFDLLEQACEEFEAIDPPFAAGLLDAKISITQFAIRADDHARMFSILHSILAEAEEKGCLEARARCLVFESSLFVSENPPLKGAFENLITRLHLINNPALLLQALGNLFIYSLRHLEEPDQAFLMARLRNLQEVLEEGCYQDLYETYIEKRYSWAIENRLAQFLEGDQDWHEEDDREMTE